MQRKEELEQNTRLHRIRNDSLRRDSQPFENRVLIDPSEQVCGRMATQASRPQPLHLLLLSIQLPLEGARMAIRYVYVHLLE